MATGGLHRNADLECLMSSEFLDNLECQYGLLDSLRLLLKNDFYQYLSHSQLSDQKKELVKFLNASNIEYFKNALRKTHQTHLANFVSNKGIRKAPYDDEWPSSPFDIELIKKYRVDLVESIHTSNAVDQLLADGCLSQQHKEAILSKPTSYDQNRLLLDIMERRSIGKLKKFVQYLKDNHPHIPVSETRTPEIEKTNDTVDQNKRAEEMTKKTTDKKVPPKQQLKIAKSPTPTQEEKQKNVEKKVVKDTTSSRLDSHSTCEILENKKNKNSNRPVSGVTVVDEEIFVVRNEQSQVYVYDSHSLRASRDINIADMRSPQGLAGCAYNRALYISDLRLECIHRVDLTDNSVTRWEMRKNHEPLCLSVTAEHSLLVTVLISETEFESGVVEYTSEGQQVREIRFDRSIKHAWHTVQLSSDQFIVSHGWDDSSSLHRVCVINAEGQIIKSFGREKGRGEDQLDVPRSLAIDEKSKHVFVADTVNNRVLMFDSELTTRLGEVHVSRDLTLPWRLYFDSSTDRLFVADFRPRLFVVTRPELRN